MNSNPVQILTKILEIIGYEDDKTLFIDEFLDINLQQALLELLDRLPFEKKQLFKTQFDASEKTLEKTAAIIQTYITPEEYNKALEKTTSANFQEYIQAVEKTVPENKRDELYAYLQTITTYTPLHTDD